MAEYVVPPLRLCIYRRQPLSEYERLLLDLLAAEIALVVKPRFEWRYARALRKAGDDGLGPDVLPGTRFADLTSRLSRAFGVRAALYATAHAGLARVEYAAEEPRPYRRAQYQVVEKEWPLGERLQDALRLGRPFFWQGQDEIAELRPRWLPGLEEQSATLLFVPVSRASTCIGFWCFLFGRAPRPSDRLLAELHLDESVVTSAGFLMQRRFKAMIVEPIYRGRDTKVAEGSCAVLMPFTERWSERIWSNCIGPYAADMGFEAVRASDLYGRDVMEDIWDMIVRAEVVIADITNRNANVFYELGLAHAIGKHVILITQATSDIPFDLNRYRHIIYEDNADGYDALKKGLTGALAEVLQQRPRP